jgi:hypothetical protein
MGPATRTSPSDWASRSGPPSRSRTVRSLEIAALLFFALLGMARLVGSDWATEHAVAVSFAGLGLFSLGGAALGRPWTAEYARADYGDVPRPASLSSTARSRSSGVPSSFSLRSLSSCRWGCGRMWRAGPSAGSRPSWDRGCCASHPLAQAGAAGALRLAAPAIGGARGDGAYDVAVSAPASEHSSMRWWAASPTTGGARSSTTGPDASSGSMPAYTIFPARARAGHPTGRLRRWMRCWGRPQQPNWLDIRGDRLAAALRPFVAQLAERKAAA